MVDFSKIEEIENNKKGEFKSLNIEEISQSNKVINKPKKVKELSDNDNTERKQGRPKKDEEEIKCYRVSFYLTSSDYETLVNKNINNYDLSYFLRNEIKEKILN